MSSSNTNTPLTPTPVPTPIQDDKEQCQKSQYFVFFEEPSRKNRSIIVGIIAVCWILAGVLAYFFSLACIGGSTFKHNFIGLLIAAFLGPIYFGYWWWMRQYGYCYNNPLPIS